MVCFVAQNMVCFSRRKLVKSLGLRHLTLILNYFSLLVLAHYLSQFLTKWPLWAVVDYQAIPEEEKHTEIRVNDQNNFTSRYLLDTLFAITLDLVSVKVCTSREVVGIIIIPTQISLFIRRGHKAHSVLQIKKTFIKD